MRTIKTSIIPWLVLLAALLCISPLRANAQMPGPHPEYLHALSDLRLARAYLQNVTDPGVRGDAEHAIGEIDKAMNEIKKASIDDGKSLTDHPPVDTGQPARGRFHRTLELLHSARKDCAAAENIPQAQGLRDRALSHIDWAINTVNQAITRQQW